MEYSKNEITINKDEYDYLNQQAMKYAMLLQILIDEAEKNDGWGEEKNPLIFSVDKLNFILNIIEKEEYKKKVKKLNSSKEDNNNE